MSAAVVLRAGAAPAHVFVHGFTQTARSFKRAADVAPADGRRIVGLAVPGHHPGVAVAPTWAQNVSLLADRLDAAAGEEPVHIVGYSLGARLALALVCAAPQRFERATLIGVHPGLETSEERAARRDSDQRWAQLLRERGIAAFVSAWQALPLWRSQLALSPELLAEQERIRLAHDPSALAASLDVLGLGNMPSMRAALAALELDVTVVTGSLDDKFTHIARTLGAAHRIVDGVGHNVVLEAPAAIW